RRLDSSPGSSGGCFTGGGKSLLSCFFGEVHRGRPRRRAPQLGAVAPARRPDDRLEQVGGHVGSRAGAAEHIAFGQQLIVGRHRRRPRSATSSRVCASPVESACCTLSTYSVTT